MAIAGIVVTGTEPVGPGMLEGLRAVPGLGDLRRTEDPRKLAAVFEAPSEAMQAGLTGIEALDGVLTVELAFLSYEDDLEERGAIGCPPHRRRHAR